MYAWGHGGNGRLGLGTACEAALVPALITATLEKLDASAGGKAIGEGGQA